MSKSKRRSAAGRLMMAFAAVCILGGCAGKGDKTMKPLYHLAFEEASGKVTEEVSGKTYPIRYVFSEAKYKKPEWPKHVTGVAGEALLFDGYSTWIETEMPEDDMEALSVSVWVAPRAFATRTDRAQTGVISATDGTGGFELALFNYGSWCFTAVTNRGVYKLWDEGNPLDLYRWNQLTAVFDSAAKEMRLYKNGELISRCETSASVIKAPQCTALIGKSREEAKVEEIFTVNMFSGLMDELEIYGEALSDEEVRERYRSLGADRAPEGAETLWMDPQLLGDDRYAPQYHMRVPQNWQNETYGFFWYNGYYHAFCQRNLLGPYYTDGQRWGHLISEDLIHWREIAPALVPEENGIDNNSVFSGCAVLDGAGHPKLFYTGVSYENDFLNLITSASPADLSDPALTVWKKSGKIAVAQGELSTRDNFRDPFIYQENGAYYMLIGGTNKETGGGAIYCYKARDDTLEVWDYCSVLYSGDSRKYEYLGSCYELPNLFRLTSPSGNVTKYMLMFSPIGNVNGVYYLIGDFDARTGAFLPDREEPYRYDLGPKSQVLCPSGFYDPHTGRNLLITMSRTGLSSQERFDSGWATAFTLIKEITLSEDGVPHFEPIREYETLNGECLLDLEEGAYSVEEVNELLCGITGDQLRIEVVLDPGTDQRVGIYVKQGGQGGERVDISYDLTKETLFIDTSKSSTAMRNNGAGGGQVPLNGENICLTVFVDRSMVEAYLNGLNQVTAFGYNESSEANGLSLYSSGKEAKVRSLRIYRVHSSLQENIPAFWGE